MDKHKPHYELEDIKRVFCTVESIRMTVVSKFSMATLRLKKTDVWNVVQNLSRRDFYKSMTSHSDHKIWQDVYHAEYLGIRLYLKFTVDVDGYLLISFKQR